MLVVLHKQKKIFGDDVITLFAGKMSAHPEISHQKRNRLNHGSGHGGIFALRAFGKCSVTSTLYSTSCTATDGLEDKSGLLEPFMIVFDVQEGSNAEVISTN